MTTEYVFAISRRDAPGVLHFVVPLKTERAQGRPGARCTRGLMCKMHKANAHEHTGSAETLRPSPRNGFTAYSALSSVTGLSCHRRSQEALASWKLDTSVGVSGPHDFAVRAGPRSSVAASRPPHPTPSVRDDRDSAPRCGVGWGELVEVICPTAKAKYFPEVIWTTRISLSDQSNFDCFGQAGIPGSGQFVRRAGTPTAVHPLGTSFSTTHPAPILA